MLQPDWGTLDPAVNRASCQTPAPLELPLAEDWQTLDPHPSGSLDTAALAASVCCSLPAPPPCLSTVSFSGQETLSSHLLARGQAARRALCTIKRPNRSPQLLPEALRAI